MPQRIPVTAPISDSEIQVPKFTIFLRGSYSEGTFKFSYRALLLDENRSTISEDVEAYISELRLSSDEDDQVTADAIEIALSVAIDQEKAEVLLTTGSEDFLGETFQLETVANRPTRPQRAGRFASFQRLIGR